MGRDDGAQRDRRVRQVRCTRTTIERSSTPSLARRRASAAFQPAQVALAWVARHPAVVAPIVGATKPHHLDDAVASVDLELTDDEVAQLEAPYTPRAVVGFA